MRAPATAPILALALAGVPAAAVPGAGADGSAITFAEARGVSLGSAGATFRWILWESPADDASRIASHVFNVPRIDGFYAVADLSEVTRPRPGAAIPEPGAALLFAGGALAVARRARRGSAS